MALDPTALFNLSYGLYVLTAREDGRDCGCIVNTVTQVTAEPPKVAVAVSKQNLTTSLIERSGLFNAVALTEEATMRTNSRAFPTARMPTGCGIPRKPLPRCSPAR